MRLERDVPVGDFTVRLAVCECGAADCDGGGYLFARHVSRHLWITLSAPPPEEFERRVETTVALLEGDPLFREAIAAMAEAYGWGWDVLDEELAAQSFFRWNQASPEVLAEIEHWGPVGVRGLRRLTGNAPASVEAALECVRRARLDDGGGRITAGPLAR